MSDNEKRTKPKYEAPIVVALGELATGAGDCIDGASDSTNCTAGEGTLGHCEAGSAALTYCVAGGSKIL